MVNTNNGFGRKLREICLNNAATNNASKRKKVVVFVLRYVLPITSLVLIAVEIENVIGCNIQTKQAYIQCQQFIRSCDNKNGLFM